MQYCLQLYKESTLATHSQTCDLKEYLRIQLDLVIPDFAGT